MVVETLTGTQLHIELADDATVNVLKREIALRENLPHERLILYLYDDHRVLLNNDDISLTQYGVQDSSLIYLFFHSLDDEDNVDILDEGFSYLSSPIRSMSGDDYLVHGEISRKGSSPNEKEAEIIAVTLEDQKPDQPAACPNVFETIAADEDDA
ncbi:hypothetical protein Ancab_008020 [Ancistrocladus abbreviatus]